MYRIVEHTTVTDVAADFEIDWAGAETVTPELIMRMTNKPRKGASRGVIRSLSKELDDEASSEAP